MKKYTTIPVEVGHVVNVDNILLWNMAEEGNLRPDGLRDRRLTTTSDEVWG